MSHLASSGIKKTAIPCSCGCSVVLVTEFEEWGSEPAETFLSFYTSVYDNKLRRRIQAAWRVIRGKDPWLHGVELSGDELAQMRKVFEPPRSD